MTEATAIKPTVTPKTRPEISYQVSMPHPTFHLFEVRLTVKNWTNETLNLKMPVWTPGSYLIREYSKNLQEFTPQNGQSKEKLAFEKISKNHWQIKTKNVTEITVFYRMYANELTVRTNHLDQTHGYFNGAALFFYIPSLEKEAITVQIDPPKNWQVATPLPCLSQEKHIYQSPDFDTLVDSPFEIGIHQRYDFEVENKPHQWIIWGEGNFESNQVIEDTKKIIEVESQLYGGLPYDDYLFLLHLSGSGYGGLEHKNSCTLNYPRLGFRAKDKYNRFMQLVAHEFFHLWNIKRIRPKALETFDYEQENYTPSLWFAEGATSYYDILIPLRAKIYDSKSFLENISKDITRFLQIPGRLVQPLSESSFDAWIKLYRRDANSDNSQISYYLKGELVCLLLDLFMRSQSDHQRTLDDVMRLMWERFGKGEIGYTPQQLKSTFEEVAQTDLTDFFDRYLHSKEELPFDDYFEPFGLELKPINEDETFPYLGIKVQSENNKEIIKFVEIESPAAIAGIDAEDELLAIDGIRITADQLNERLKDYQTGDMMQITVFHQDELRTLSVQLAPPQPNRYEVVTITDPSKRQQQNLTKWLNSAV
jgi:predicted metalloprotease with PDZ domain